MYPENQPGSSLAPYRGSSNPSVPGYDLASPMMAPASEQFSPWDYLAIVLKRKWIIIATVVITTTLVTISALREPKIYQATARIAIEQEDTSIFGIQKLDTVSQVFEEWTVNIDTQMNILQSVPLSQDVVQALQLQNRPEFGGTHDKAKNASAPGAPQLSNAGNLAAAAAIFRSRISVVNVPNTRIVAVTLRTSDREIAAQAVNTLANRFIEQSYKTRVEQTTKITDWLQQQLGDLQTKVEVSQQKLVDYQRLHDIVGTDEKSNFITQKLDLLNSQLSTAEADRMQKEALDHTLSSTSPELIPTSIAATNQFGSVLASLRTKENEIKDQLAEMSATYGPSYPKVVDLKNKLKQVEANIEVEIKKTSQRYHNDYLAAQRRESMIRSQFEQQKLVVNKLNESAIQYNILKRDLDSNRTLYEDLLKKMKEANITAGLKSNNIRIVDPAEVPTVPISPNVPRSFAVAFMGSLTLGIGLAFLLESLDKTIRNAEQVQFVAGLPALGVLPMASFSRKHIKGELEQRQSIGLVAYSRPKSQIAEAYRALGTSILLSSLDRPHKIVMVTSALPEEGKTTTAVNSAIVLAQQGGKVLLIDADLRRPSVHKTLGLEPRCGLSMLADDPSQIEQCILASPHIPNLHFLPAGPTPVNPAELLGSQRMKDLLKHLRTKYDHIVVDTPPVLSITDAVRLSPEADAVMLVIRSGVTTKESLCRARDLLYQVKAPVIGVVVNAIDFSTPAYYNYYAYNNYGQKYYSDKN